MAKESAVYIKSAICVATYPYVIMPINFCISNRHFVVLL